MGTKTTVLSVHTGNTVFLSIDKLQILYYPPISIKHKGVSAMNTLSVLFFSKIVIAVILLAFLYHLFQAGRYGRKFARALWSDGTELIKHQKYAKRSFLIALFAVLAVETVVRFNKPLYDTLFWVHLCFFAIPCFILFALIRFRYTGLEHPDIHPKLIYWGLLPTLVGTLLTGLPLLYRL